MKNNNDRKKNNFKRIIELSSDYVDAGFIADKLCMTVMTARKYMRTLIDPEIVTYTQQKNKTKGLRLIKAAVTSVDDKTLNMLCEQYYAIHYEAEEDKGKVIATPKQARDKQSGIVRLLSNPSAEMIEKFKEQSKQYRKEMRKRSVGSFGGSSSLNGIY